MKITINILAIAFLIIVMFFAQCQTAERSGEQSRQPDKTVFPEFTVKIATNFAGLALRCIQKEYPNKLSHVINNASEVQSPGSLHPVFFGCFDWHSCVHGHWMLIRLLKTFPHLPQADSIQGRFESEPGLVYAGNCFGTASK